MYEFMMTVVLLCALVVVAALAIGEPLAAIAVGGVPICLLIADTLRRANHAND